MVFVAGEDGKETKFLAGIYYQHELLPSEATVHFVVAPRESKDVRWPSYNTVAMAV